MSSLGLSLLILIVVAIGALAAYNFWLTRKPSRRSDELLTGFSSSPSARQEPSFSAGTHEPYLDDSPLPDRQASDVQPHSEPAAGQPVMPAFDVPDPVAPATDPADSNKAPQSDATNDAAPELAPQWAAGILPDAPPAPAPPDLNWQAEAPPPVVEPDKSVDVPSFQGSIEHAMRLQKEADDLIESVPADGSTESADLSPSETGVPSDVLPMQETAPSAPLADSVQGPDPDAGGAPAGTARESAQDETTPEEPAEIPAAAVQETVSNNDASFDELASAEPEPSSAATPPAPGWSGIDAERQAANFVATVNLELASPSKGSELASLTNQLTHAGTKPVRVTAGNPPAGGSLTLRTEPIDPDREYALLRFEVLQVNRHGPIDGVEYSGFVSAVDKIGESLGVLVNPPDMNVVLIKSRVLDAEVASLDAQVAVNVETEGSIATEKFESVAAEIGLTESERAGVYVSRDDDGFVVYTVQLNAEANRVVLVLDVPTVPSALQPIRKMVECAWAFAQALNGKMIDDNGRSIDNPLFERIESQIEMHYQALLAAGVPAGSDLARQVYNQV